MLNEKFSIRSPSRFLTGKAYVKVSGPTGEIHWMLNPADER